MRMFSRHSIRFRTRRAIAPRTRSGLQAGGGEHESMRLSIGEDKAKISTHYDLLGAVREGDVYTGREAVVVLITGYPEVTLSPLVA